MAEESGTRQDAEGLPAPQPPCARREQLFDIPVAPCTLEEAIELIDWHIRQATPLQIGVINAAKVVNMHKDPELRESVLSSDIILADGAAIVWSGRLLGVHLPERVAGIDLMFAMLDLAHRRGYRVYLLGARERVLERVVANIRRDYPNAVIAGRHHGYFAPEDEEAIARDIERQRPQMLFVAMTSPKKENFLARWSPQVGHCVCHGVGGSFDVYAGLVKRAPLSVQRLGLEWAYRVMQEPRRLWRRYLVTNTRFILMTLQQLVARCLP